MAVDLLTTLDRVKSMIGKSLTTTDEDFLLNLLIVQVSSEIAQSCGRSHFLLTNAASNVTKSYCGTGTDALDLDQWPVYTPVLTGNVALGSATITALSSTAHLFVGQGVSGVAFIPPAGQSLTTTGSAPLAIQSIDSATQVTLNGAAQLTATATPIGFGVQVWENQLAYGFTGSYQSTNLLAEGGDYWIDRDQGDGTCKSGLLYRIGTAWQASWSYGGWGGYWVGNGPDLSATQTPGPANYQVQAVIGYESVPPNLELAAIWCVMKARMLKPFGRVLQSESDDGYSYSLGQAAAQSAVQLGMLDDYVGGILNKYRIAALPR